MTCSQYNNVIQFTLADEMNQGKDNLELVRCILDNLSIPLPKGDYQDVLCTLLNGEYMNWIQCFKKQAHQSANLGLATIGLTKDDIVVIEPDESVLTLGTGLKDSANPVARTVEEITQEEQCEMQFFAFSSNSSGCTTPWWCPTASFNFCDACFGAGIGGGPGTHPCNNNGFISCHRCSGGFYRCSICFGPGSRSSTCTCGSSGSNYGYGY